MPKVIFFDIDGTLTESKQPLTEEMATLLARLLAATKVALISGGALPQFLKQVVEKLPENAPFENLYLLPTSGAMLYEWHKGAWSKVYEERLSEEEALLIKRAILSAVAETEVVDLSKPAYGERIEYRGSQVTFSALGQQAPFALKKVWDADHVKRRMLQAAVADRLQGFSVSMGGSTSIDVTKQGIDKAYGVRKLCERLGISEADALYVGDELIAGGNDEAVFKTAVRTNAVSGPEDTRRVIEALFTS
ncbi:MAG: HAD-IIB family hydrolase [Patescibacteria group bacterium]|nr:HAD-IIB family hydrolase [Patescibacteria group bacterium]